MDQVNSSSASARHWAAFNETSFVGGMHALFWICRVFGRWPFRVVLYPVLLWYVATQGRARRASSAYLARVGAPSGWLGVLRHFAAFAETILDKMLLWGGLFDFSGLRLHGDQAVLAHLATGRGALLVCAHLGNLDLCRALSLHTPGLKVSVLVHTRHAQAFNAMLARLDPRSALDVLQVTDMGPVMAMQLAERIGRGELVVIAGDRIPVSSTPRVAYADFLGAAAPFPVGPWVMAGVLGCPVFGMFCTRAGAAYDVHFEALRTAVVLPRRAREAALAALVRDYAARLERHVRRAPLEWFNFYDFWHLPDTATQDAAQ